ncbi:hypothetical protein GCM10011418_37810 [Sphingobacterium alkalisoli]|nr:hypothetical protein GCM10011418_37810 [Sphingobacterium alkalisoli]
MPAGLHFDNDLLPCTGLDHQIEDNCTDIFCCPDPLGITVGEIDNDLAAPEDDVEKIDKINLIAK